jgi:hypothetical protein
MPSLDVELVFLMVRQQTPEHIVERMLLFSVQARKPFLTLEIIKRLRPSAHLLGRVLMMCFNISSIANSACYSLTHEGNDCCQILLDKGASVSQEVAVRVSIADADEGTANSIVLSRYLFVFHLRLRNGRVASRRTSEGLCDIDGNPNTNVWRDAGCDGIDMSHEFDWFPLQLPTAIVYLGDGTYLDPCDGLDDAPHAKWVFSDRVRGLQFYSNANSSTPPQGNWLLYPRAGYGEGSTLVVSHIDATSLVDAYATHTQSLLGVAEEVRRAGSFLVEDVEDAHPQREHCHHRREDATVERNIFRMPVSFQQPM